MDYYTIGKFAKLTGVSTKTLIWYDHIGLLKPDKVNEINGYRYYTNESLKKIFSIKFLQSMDFTINQIMKFSKDEIQNKIKELQKKIHFIQMNTLYLNDFVKNNPNEFMLQIEDKSMLSGRWYYKKSTQSFENALTEINCTKLESMPKTLIFGETIATDTKDIFTFSNNEIIWNDKHINILVINNGTKLILYQLNTKENIVDYHIYSHNLKNGKNTDTQLKTIVEKQKAKVNEDNHQQFKLQELTDKSLQGKWKLLGEIKESDISNFDKTKLQKILIQIWYPAFEELEINENKVKILKDNQEYQFFDKIFNSADLLCKILRSSDNKIYLHFEIFKQYYELSYFKNNANEYLCMNINKDADIDEKLYIYERVN